MRMPAYYTAKEVATWHVSEEYEPGRWRPARPCPFHFGALDWSGWRIRIILAWRVFVGRCDALSWGENSGEWTNDQVNYRDCKHPEYRKTT